MNGRGMMGPIRDNPGFCEMPIYHTHLNALFVYVCRYIYIYTIIMYSEVIYTYISSLVYIHTYTYIHIYIVHIHTDTRT